MALLLGNLRNLTTLYAELPETDVFLEEVLQRAIESRPDQTQSRHSPLNALREAHLTSAWNYREGKDDKDQYKLHIHSVWPVFRLPNIQKLSVFDFESLGASKRLANCAAAKTSSITDLTLVYHEDSLLTFPDTMTLLTLPRRLTRLSVWINDNDLYGVQNQLSNAELWNGIRQYEDCLELLDIYRDCSGLILPTHSANNSHFGVMKGFKRLESLSVQSEVLLGCHCREEKRASFDLKDTLPPTLKSLVLYGHEGLSRDKTLGRQLQDVTTDTNLLPRLNYVALEKRPETLDIVLREVPSARVHFADPPPHIEVERACEERGGGIRYETKPISSCIKGGRGRQYYRYVLVSRFCSEGRRPLRKYLTTYLDRRKGLTHNKRGFLVYRKDGKRVNGEIETSIEEDLDTYELEWGKLLPREEKEEYDSEWERAGLYSEDELDWDQWEEEEPEESDRESRIVYFEKDALEADDRSLDGVW